MFAYTVHCIHKERIIVQSDTLKISEVFLVQMARICSLLYEWYIVAVSLDRMSMLLRKILKWQWNSMSVQMNRMTCWGSQIWRPRTMLLPPADAEFLHLLLIILLDGQCYLPALRLRDTADRAHNRIHFVVLRNSITVSTCKQPLIHGTAAPICLFIQQWYS